MTKLRLLNVGLACVVMFAAACGDDEDCEVNAQGDGCFDPKAVEPGVCDLSVCPEPEMGVACCLPDARCGMDPAGLGLNCAPNPGDPIGSEPCELKDCPLPLVGEACCTPNSRCGTDPYASGLVCFANPPPVNIPPDSAYLRCDSEECPTPPFGFPCCLPDGSCGADLSGWGFCSALPRMADAGLPPGLTPPDDPSVNGECPSYLGVLGPVWGCCTDIGVCGTFYADECLIPIGTPLPVPGDDDDAGLLPGQMSCTPPPAVN